VRGHHSLRYVATGNCIECIRASRADASLAARAGARPAGQYARLVTGTLDQLAAARVIIEAMGMGWEGGAEGLLEPTHERVVAFRGRLLLRNSRRDASLVEGFREDPVAGLLADQALDARGERPLPPLLD
jgi:hypothetical protein